MKLRHTIGIVVLVLAAATGGGAWWLYSSLDQIVKGAIERYGPEITQVPVRVEGVKLAPVEGKGSISGLRLGNPKGFRTESALKVGEISLHLDAASIAKDVIVIREIVLRAPEITYETGDAGNNLERIRNNIQSYAAKLSGDKSGEAGPKKKFVIENLYIRDARANVNTAITLGKTVSLPVPDLHLRDIGRKSNGATAGEATKQVWEALLRSTTTAVSRIGGAVKEGAKSLIDSGRKLFGK